VATREGLCQVYRRATAVDVRDLLAEGSVNVSARTVLARAHKFGPLLATFTWRATRLAEST
jgi:hypothetical protein